MTGPTEPRAPIPDTAEADDPAPQPEGISAHTVPATTVERPAPCPRCGTLNRPGLTFCAGCGQRLVAADAATMTRPAESGDSVVCPRCASPNRPGATFCQQCGANLRMAPAPPVAVPDMATRAARRAWLGPLVLLIAAVGLVIAWLLPFHAGVGSLYDQAAGPGGFGFAFWTAYPDTDFLGKAYYGLAAPLPVLSLLLIVLAAAGVVWAHAGRIQAVGLGVAFLWAAGFGLMFVVVEIGGGLGDNLIGMLRGLSSGGLIGFLTALIAVIGIATRFGDG